MNVLETNETWAYQKNNDSFVEAPIATTEYKLSCKYVCLCIVLPVKSTMTIQSFALSKLLEAKYKYFDTPCYYAITNEACLNEILLKYIVGQQYRHCSSVS